MPPRRKTIYFTEAQWAKLEAQALAEDRTTCGVIKFAVMQYLAQHKFVVPTFARFRAQYEDISKQVREL